MPHVTRAFTCPPTNHCPNEASATGAPLKSSGIIGDAYRHSHTQLNHALPSLSVHARAWRGEMNAESDGACEAVTARRSLVELVQFHACTTTPQTAMELGLEFGPWLWASRWPGWLPRFFIFIFFNFVFLQKYIFVLEIYRNIPRLPHCRTDGT